MAYSLTRESLRKIDEGLANLVVSAEDSKDFEWILNNSIMALLRALPNGERNYGDGPENELGVVWLGRTRCGPGQARLGFNLSPRMREKRKFNGRDIGTLDLRRRTYSLVWDYPPPGELSYNPLYGPLRSDVDKVMEILGFQKGDVSPTPCLEEVASERL